MIHYRKHTIKYNGYWYAERKNKRSIDFETLLEAKQFVDQQCNLGFGSFRRKRGVKQ